MASKISQIWSAKANEKRANVPAHFLRFGRVVCHEPRANRTIVENGLDFEHGHRFRRDILTRRDFVFCTINKSSDYLNSAFELKVGQLRFKTPTFSLTALISLRFQLVLA